MKGIVLTASGYTWTCPECGRENYTGAAPSFVSCPACKAEWSVVRLSHRDSEANRGQASLFDQVQADSDERLFAAGREI